MKNGCVLGSGRQPCLRENFYIFYNSQVSLPGGNENGATTAIAAILMYVYTTEMQTRHTLVSYIVLLFYKHPQFYVM